MDNAGHQEWTRTQNGSTHTHLQGWSTMIENSQVIYFIVLNAHLPHHQPFHTQVFIQVK